MDTLYCWLWILAAWIIVAVSPTWWTVLLALPVIGCAHYGLFIIGHDGLHRRLFKKVRHNDLFADLFLLGPIGAITRINNKNHLAHHRFLASEDDPDRHKHGCFNKTELSEVFGYLTGLSSVFRTLWNVYQGRSVASASAASQPAHAPRAAGSQPDGYTRRDFAILAGWQIVLIGGLSGAIGWWAYPTLWLLPIYLFTFLGDNLRSFAEHSHPESDDLADQHRLITYTSHPIERLLLAPMNMNYHAAHHLWPSIPYYNLPQADREMCANPGADALERRGTYLGYLYRYYVALPLQECKLSRQRKAASRPSAL
jgi:fatty acid desaturase